MDEVALHDLLSGRQRGLRAGLIRGSLHLPSWLYSAAARIRNLAYDYRILPVHRAGAPVISLGNITTGGTGKTPLAAWLANWLTTAGCKPALISRGYRSLKSKSVKDGQSMTEPHESNDEKLVLDRLCPGIPHLQQQDRVESAKRAISEFGCDTLILDDGFQHRRLHRDLDLVLIDAMQPWGYGYVLPRGLLRENLVGLKRADLILITRADQLTESQRLIMRAMLIEIRGTDESVEVAFRPSRLLDPQWQSRPLADAEGRKAFAFCGIGNPDAFRRTVESIGASCLELEPFPDHHHYNQAELTKLAKRARELSVDVVFTTMKDLVKIPAAAWTGPPLFAVEIDVQFLKGGDLLESRLRRLIETP